MKRGSREVGHAALTFDLIFDPSTTMVVQAARIEMKMRCVALSQNLNIFAPARESGRKKPEPASFLREIFTLECCRLHVPVHNDMN